MIRALLVAVLILTPFISDAGGSSGKRPDNVKNLEKAIEEQHAILDKINKEAAELGQSLEEHGQAKQQAPGNGSSKHEERDEQP